VLAGRRAMDLYGDEERGLSPDSLITGGRGNGRLAVAWRALEAGCRMLDDFACGDRSRRNGRSRGAGQDRRADVEKRDGEAFSPYREFHDWRERSNGLVRLQSRAAARN